mmetsp:Transcript_93320/g.260948  ORF Transcript_93320/g.260948 Transcript_93320/m.260948 type:complete len:91 (+) Transcript_93320:1763-2035(+)
MSLLLMLLHESFSPQSRGTLEDLFFQRTVTDSEAHPLPTEATVAHKGTLAPSGVQKVCEMRFLGILPCLVGSLVTVHGFNNLTGATSTWY